MDKPNRVILVVDDDSNDVPFLRRALAEVRAGLPVPVVSEGEQAIHYLNLVGEFEDRGPCPLPCLVVLDLKLPKQNGREVVSWARRYAELEDQELPVSRKAA